MISLKMILGFCVFIAAVSAHVSGSIWEATEGQNMTIHFKCELERFGSVRIIFKAGNQPKSLIGKLCSREAAAGCESMKTEGVSLQVEGGNVSLILHDVNMSRSGLYEAHAFFEQHVCKKSATLVVNKASSVAPQTSIPNNSHHLPDSSRHHWITVIPLIVLVGVFFCKLRRILCFQEKQVQNHFSDCVSVDMNDSGENAKALLAS